MRKQNNKKAALFPVVFIFLFLFAGCFDMKREIRMNPDGSGLENMYVTLDSEFFEKMNSLAELDKTGKWKGKLDSLNDNTILENSIVASLGRVGGTSIKELKITPGTDGSKEIYLQYSFDEPAVWAKVSREGLFSFSNQLPVIYSTVKFQYDEGDLTFKHITRKVERSFSDELFNSTFASMFPAKSVTYSIEFPFSVKETNASSSAGSMLFWESTIENLMFNQQTDTAALEKDPELELTYAEKIDRTIGRVSQKENPLIRVQVYNRNKEPVKIGTGIVLRDGVLVTNFELMNLIEGAGFFSVILPSDSLAGIDEMTEKDLDKNQDLVFLRFGSADKFKPIKYASFSGAKYGDKVKIFYYPNTLSSTVYSMEGMVSGTKKWTSKISVIEIKPSKPISLDGGAVFNEAGDFLGMITKAYDGEVGKLYLVPGEYIKSNIP